MNQFNNIGSMFPGAEHKLTRALAKHVLALKGSGYEISGLVLSNPEGERCIIDKGNARWISKQEMCEIMPKPMPEEDQPKPMPKEGQ